MIINPYRFAAAPPPSGDLLTDLNNWWNLNEASGDRIDSHGVLDLTPGAGVGYDAGSGSATFNGTSTGQLSTPTGPETGPTGFTFAFWINRDVGTGGNQGYAIANHLLIYSFANGDIDWNLNGIVQTGVYEPAEGAWECWVFVSDGTNMKIFVNGVLSAIAARAYAEPTLNSLTLGNQASRYYTGKMKSVGLWNVAISDGSTTTVGATATGQVAEYYNGGTPLLYSQL